MQKITGHWHESLQKQCRALVAEQLNRCWSVWFPPDRLGSRERILGQSIVSNWTDASTAAPHTHKQTTLFHTSMADPTSRAQRAFPAAAAEPDRLECLWRRHRTGGQVHPDSKTQRRSKSASWRRRPLSLCEQSVPRGRRQLACGERGVPRGIETSGARAPVAPGAVALPTGPTRRRCS